MSELSLEQNKSVAYGSIYLDTGEDAEKMAKEQIESFREQLPTFVFFDVIAKKGKTADAMAVRGYVAQEMHAELGLEFYQVYTAVAFNDSDRPAREAMMRFIKESNK